MEETTDGEKGLMEAAAASLKVEMGEGGSLLSEGC